MPIQIYTMIKISVTPEINAISTLFMLLTLVLIIIANRLDSGILQGEKKS